MNFKRKKIIIVFPKFLHILFISLILSLYYISLTYSDDTDLDIDRLCSVAKDNKNGFISIMKDIVSEIQLDNEKEIVECKWKDEKNNWKKFKMKDGEICGRAGKGEVSQLLKELDSKSVVSRFQFYIKKNSEGKIIIKDLSSKNGTTINSLNGNTIKLGKEINETEIELGTEIVLPGNIKLLCSPINEAGKVKIKTSKKRPQSLPNLEEVSSVDREESKTTPPLSGSSQNLNGSSNFSFAGENYANQNNFPDSEVCQKISELRYKYEEFKNQIQATKNLKEKQKKELISKYDKEAFNTLLMNFNNKRPADFIKKCRYAEITPIGKDPCQPKGAAGHGGLKVVPGDTSKCMKKWDDIRDLDALAIACDNKFMGLLNGYTPQIYDVCHDGQDVWAVMDRVGAKIEGELLTMDIKVGCKTYTPKASKTKGKKQKDIDSRYSSTQEFGFRIEGLSLLNENSEDKKNLNHTLNNRYHDGLIAKAIDGIKFLKSTQKNLRSENYKKIFKEIESDQKKETNKRSSSVICVQNKLKELYCRLEKDPEFDQYIVAGSSLYIAMASKSSNSENLDNSCEVTMIDFSNAYRKVNAGQHQVPVSIGDDVSCKKLMKSDDEHFDYRASFLLGLRNVAIKFGAEENFQCQ